MKKNVQHRWHLLFNTTLVFAIVALAPCVGRPEGPIATTGGPHVPFKGCFYYEHDSFKGQRRDIPAGLQRKYVGDAWNDKISSIACSPGCGLRVWEHRDFTGASKTFNGAYVYVGDAWNDRISSMRVVCP